MPRAKLPCKIYFCALCSKSTKLTKKFKECDDCHLVRYCGPTCKEQDKPNHKALCEKRKYDLDQLKLLQVKWEKESEVCGKNEDEGRDADYEGDKEKYERLKEEYNSLNEKCNKTQGEYLELLTKLRKETQKLAEERENNYKGIPMDYHLIEKAAAFLDEASIEVYHDKTVKEMADLLYYFMILGKTSKLKDKEDFEDEQGVIFFGFADLLFVLLKSGFPELNKGPFSSFRNVASLAPQGTPLRALHTSGIPMDEIENYCHGFAEKRFDKLWKFELKKWTAAWSSCKDPWLNFKHENFGEYLMDLISNEPNAKPDFTFDNTHKDIQYMGDLFRRFFQKYCPKMYLHVCQAWRSGKEEEYSQYNGSDQEYQDSDGNWHDRPPKKRRLKDKKYWDKVKEKRKKAGWYIPDKPNEIDIENRITGS